VGCPQPDARVTGCPTLRLLASLARGVLGLRPTLGLCRVLDRRADLPPLIFLDFVPPGSGLRRRRGKVRAVDRRTFRPPQRQRLRGAQTGGWRVTAHLA
jgi:hypothetical protein